MIRPKRFFIPPIECFGIQIHKVRMRRQCPIIVHIATTNARSPCIKSIVFVQERPMITPNSAQRRNFTIGYSTHIEWYSPHFKSAHYIQLPCMVIDNAPCDIGTQFIPRISITRIRCSSSLPRNRVFALISLYTFEPICFTHRRIYGNRQTIGNTITKRFTQCPFINIFCM